MYSKYFCTHLRRNQIPNTFKNTSNCFLEKHLLDQKILEYKFFQPCNKLKVSQCISSQQLLSALYCIVNPQTYLPCNKSKQPQLKSRHGN